MQFTSALLAAAAFTGFANAVQFTNSVFNNVTAGESFTLTWSNATGPVEITLKNGNRDDLQDVSTIASGQTGSSFTWNVPATLAADTYAFEIVDSTGVENYSSQFQLIGGASSSSASASRTASASSSESASASSSGTQTASSASVSVTASSNLTTTRGSGPSSTRSATTTRGSTSASTSPTTAPNSAGMALTSNLALAILVLGALMTLN